MALIKKPIIVNKTDIPQTEPELEEKPVIEPTNTKFSWEEEQPEEYVIVEEEIPEKKKKSIWTHISNAVFGILFGTLVVLGIKYGYDYIQEAESIKLINTELEKEVKSDFSEEVKSELSLFKPKEVVSSESEKNTNKSSILEAKLYYLALLRPDGSVELRTGGTPAWRTYNPGEFAYKDFAKETGAIGEYSRYAVYPDEKTGRKALEIYLFNTNLYANLSINDAIKKFYSESSSKGERVAKEISILLNISRYKNIMKDLSDSQKEKIVNKIWEEETSLNGIVRYYTSVEEFKEKGF